MPFRYLPKPTRDPINRSFIRHFRLIICEITMHIPLKYRILHANTQCKVFHSMPLHTYASNFATSSNLQEILLAYKLNSNDPPFAHLFVLIIFEHISLIYATQTSYFMPKTF